MVGCDGESRADAGDGLTGRARALDVRIQSDLIVRQHYVHKQTEACPQPERLASISSLTCADLMSVPAAPPSSAGTN
jgi:hypothetical protein